MRLSGAGIIITGASRGLGRAIAKMCILEGARVVVCGRDSGALEEARDELQALAPGTSAVTAVTADVSRPEEVERLFRESSAALPVLTGVVNSAGIHGPKGPIDEVDWEQWTYALQVNLFGTVLVCRQALKLFRKHGYGKIVNLSGGGATKPYPFVSAYAASKAAVVRFTETMAHELNGTRIDVNALAPGAMNTRLLDDILEAGAERVGAAAYDAAVRQKAQGGSPPELAAECCLYLLSPASDGITGRLISAVWDPWAGLGAKAQELAGTDIYTLRRIIPADRGKDWG
jgi:NAD(P)-dependent dehydrogenase (short-subunit alcohol dehydrogenase family)